MPIYMDVHIIQGIKARDVAEAHMKDLFVQGEYHCKCMTYWIDEVRENVFCLIEAPSKDAVVKMHQNSHGLIPNKIIEVNSSLVESFLGRIYDPSNTEIVSDGLKVFNDPSFRILLMTRTIDPVVLRFKLGKDEVDRLLETYTRITRKNITLYGGKEVENGGSGFLISFPQAGKALCCAKAILKELPITTSDSIGLKMSINAGDPIQKSDQLFGDTIQMAHHMFAISKYFKLAMTSSVKELVAKDYIHYKENDILLLTPQDEALLETLFAGLEKNWQNHDFNLDNYCNEMAMSKSQLYRKTIMLTGLSPNLLLKSFRLEKAKDLMKKQCFNIAQVTFDSGFTSPSYFTKCFKKEYGLLPINYLELLQ